MNLSSYTFVALDLEATWLSPEKDTIIEIAAVKFSLEYAGGKYRIMKSEEHSQLIDPERELTEEISMITGITSNMLIGRKKWGEVQEKAREFIGNAIIVGHNVLFDTAMLATHGIDLSRNITLDTFELSEIFSQEVESLNLAFLAKHYGIEIAWEHRALDDTKLSIELFLHYLNHIKTLDNREISLFEYTGKKDTSGTIQALLEITEKKSERIYSFFHSPEYIPENRGDRLQKREDPSFVVKNLSGKPEEEKKLLEAIAEENTILLITNGYKQSRWIAKELWETGKKISIYRESEKFISLETISGFLEKNIWTRKESVFITKILFWLEKTTTGLIDELKFYGEERIWITLFRADVTEINRFIEKARQDESASDVLITDSLNKELFLHPLREKWGTIVFRDALSIEKNIRKQQSTQISFSECFRLIENSKTISQEKDLSEDLITAFSYISSIIEDTVERPTGPNPLPPGDFGETYFFTQKDFWHRGNKWLPLSSKLLSRNTEILKNLEFTSLEKKELAPLFYAISHLLKLIHHTDFHLSLISHIGKEWVSLQIIPRNISHFTEKLIKKQNAEDVLILGYGIANSIAQKFLKEECGFPITWEENTPPNKKIEIVSKIEITEEKTVILSTSLKHLREITQKLKNTQNIESIYTQGLSGGKAKILSLFERNMKKSVLIGLIDTWIDESNLWEKSDMVYIMKIPFDPPSDPYFLSRTIGMNNNFEAYSTPIAINTINTLIGRIHSANKNNEIRIADERIKKMNWGKIVESSLISL